MVTELIQFDPAGYAAALTELQAGGALAFPTDTVYGLGGNALSATALQAVYAIKERPASMPLPVLLADPADLALVARDVSPLAQAIAAAGWPGALTLVVPARPDLPAELVPGAPTIAVRVPDHAGLRALIRQLGAPIAGTSANRHGLPSPTTAQEVARQLDGRVRLIIDGGPSGADQASTILDLTGPQPRILRAGGFDLQRLAQLGIHLATEA